MIQPREQAGELQCDEHPEAEHDGWLQHGDRALQRVGTTTIAQICNFAEAARQLLTRRLHPQQAGNYERRQTTSLPYLFGQPTAFGQFGRVGKVGFAA